MVDIRPIFEWVLAGGWLYLTLGCIAFMAFVLWDANR